MHILEGNWNYPNQIISGAGRLAELATQCQEKGFEHPLIVTDPGLSSLPICDELKQTLERANIKFDVYDQVSANPNQEDVCRGVEQFKRSKHDSVIAFGGGSALDAAKAIALMVGQELPIWEFEDVGDNWCKVKEEGVAPVIAIPTTAGTGSEVGRASVITDSEKHLKKIIFHPKMLPVLVILDPNVTTGLPAKITAATGLDALSHCLEAFCSPSYHPMAEGIALEGMRLIKENLQLAYENGDNLEARMHMLVASSMGAAAFQKGLGAMHAIAHSIGATYGAHHGLLNAILMPYVLEENYSEIKTKLGRAARYLDLDGGSADSFISWVHQLRADLGIPRTLDEIGINLGDVQKLAAMSVEDPSAGGNPIQLSSADYERLIGNAIQGVNETPGEGA